MAIASQIGLFTEKDNTEGQARSSLYETRKESTVKIYTVHGIL